LSIEIPRGQSGRQQPVHRAKAEGGAIPGKPRPHRKKYAFALLAKVAMQHAVGISCRVVSRQRSAFSKKTLERLTTDN